MRCTSKGPSIGLPCVYVDRWLLNVGAAMSIMFTDVAAQAKHIDAKTNSAALVVITKGEPDPTWVGTFITGIKQLASFVPQYRLLHGKALRKRIKRDPSRAFVSCGSNMGCISKLGRKARAREVILARVVGSATKAQFQFLVIDVASRSLKRRTSFEVLDPQEIENILLEQFTAITGHPLPTEARFEPVEPLTLKNTETIAAQSAANGRSPTDRSWLVASYIGGGVAVVGIALTAAGIAVGAGLESSGDSIRYGAGGTPQPEVAELQKSADRKADLATGMLSAGIVTSVAGLTTMILGIFVLNRTDVSVSADIGPLGVVGRVSIPW